MRFFHYILCLLVVSGSVFQVGAQDIHFTQYTQMPLQQNPSMAGNFNGDYRFAGIYRNQYATIAVPYNTTNLNFDFKAFESKKFNSFLGSGLQLSFDQAGDSRYQTLYASIPIAYTTSFNVGSSYLNFGGGLMVGYLNKSIRTDDLRFDSQFTGEVFDATLPVNEALDQLQFSNVDVGMGYNIAFRSKNDLELSLGFAVHHLTKMKETFLNDGSELILNQRIDIPFFVRVPIRRKWELQLDYIYQEQGEQHKSLVGLMGRYYMKKDLPAQKSIAFGISYRTQDAVNGIIQYRVNNFTAGFSYDLNASRLRNASNTYGAMEISAVYIIQKVKEPLIKNKRQCFVF